MRPAPALCLLLAACATRALPDEPIFSPRSFPEVDHQLASGLRVVLHEDHSVPLVTVAAVYGSGATSDPDEAAGLAHLVEHLTFRARGGEGENRGDRLKRTGATFNATTGADTTLFYSVGHRDSLGELLQEEISRLTAPIEGVTADDFKAERRVVLNERRERMGGSTGPSYVGVLQQRLFPASHPLGRPVHGSEESLARTTLQMAQAFVERHYRPENCTLLIAGDIEASRVKALIGAWPAALVRAEAPVPHRPPLLEGPRRAPPEPPSTRLMRMTGPVKSSHLLLAWSLPAATPENEAQLRIIAAVLEASSRDAVEATLVPFTDGSILVVDRPLGPVEDPARAQNKLLELLLSERAVTLAMQATPIVRRKARVAWLRELADPLAYTLQLARHLVTTGRLSFQTDTLAYLRATTMDGVARTMRAYLKRERAVALVVDPEGAVAGGEPNDVEAHALARPGQSSIAGMGPADVLRVARPPGLGALPRFTLTNGLQVVAIQRPAAALARIDLFLPGGSATDVRYADLVAELSEDPCQPLVPLRNVGGTARIDHGPFASHFSVVVPDGNVVNGLASVAEEARCHDLSYPLFFAVQRALPHVPSTSNLAEDQADKAFREALYPAHPYGRRSLDPRMLEGVRADEANGWVKSHFRPDGALGVVVSPLPPAELRLLMTEYLGGWSSGGIPPMSAPRSPPPTAARRTVRLFAASRRAQVHLRIGCRLPVDAAALPALDVLERVVAEQANELREAWGATYGLDVEVGFFPGSAHLTIDGAVDANQAGTAVARLLALLAADATTGPDATAFTVARWEVARAFNRRFATANGLTNALLFAAQQGWPADEWDRYPGRLAALDAARVQLLMKTCAGREVVTVLGDIPTLTEQLRAAGVN